MTSAPPVEHPPLDNGTGSPSSTGARSKAMLFCPCGHEASADAWPAEPDGPHYRLVCPDCGTTLTVR